RASSDVSDCRRRPGGLHPDRSGCGEHRPGSLPARRKPGGDAPWSGGRGDHDQWLLRYSHGPCEHRVRREGGWTQHRVLDARCASLPYAAPVWNRGCGPKFSSTVAMPASKLKKLSEGFNHASARLNPGILEGLARKKVGAMAWSRRPLCVTCALNGPP